MRYFIYVILILTIFSCSDCPPQPDTTGKNCPLPLEFTDDNSYSVLTGVHFTGKLSPDGTILFVNGNEILDLKTLKISKLDTIPPLSQNTKWGHITNVKEWCPYDNNKFVALAKIGVDTIGDGKKYIYGDHLIICSIDGSYYEDITPKILGPIGSTYGLDLRAWLPDSQKGKNQFLIGYKLVFNGKLFYAIYSPETQELQEQEYKGLRAYTYDWKNQFCSNHDSSHILKFYINDKELVFKDIDSADMGYASFSPDGRYFAIAANVYNRTNRYYDPTTRLAEIWIVDVEKFMQNPVQPEPLKIINIKEKFCMFTYGLYPVFTSNNTIAVSMFKDGDTFCYLHEIDINGQYIRQLTSVK